MRGRERVSGGTGRQVRMKWRGTRRESRAGNIQVRFKGYIARLGAERASGRRALRSGLRTADGGPLGLHVWQAISPGFEWDDSNTKTWTGRLVRDPRNSMLEYCLAEDLLRRTAYLRSRWPLLRAHQRVKFDAASTELCTHQTVRIRVQTCHSQPSLGHGSISRTRMAVRIAHMPRF